MGQKHSRDDAAVSAPKRRAPPAEPVDLTGMLPFEIWADVLDYLKDPADRDALGLTCRYMLMVCRHRVRLVVIDSERARRLVTDRHAKALRRYAAGLLAPDAGAPIAYPNLICVAVYWSGKDLKAGARSRDALAPLYMAGCVASAAQRANGHTVLELSGGLSDLGRLFTHMTPRAMDVFCSFARVRVLPDYHMLLRVMKYMDKWCLSHNYTAPWPAFCLVWRNTAEDESTALANRLDCNRVHPPTCTIMREPLFAVAPLPEGEGSRHQAEYHKMLRGRLYLTPVVCTPTTDWPKLRAKQARRWLDDGDGISD